MGKMALSAYLLATKIGRVAPRRLIDDKMKAARLTFETLGDAPAARNLLKLAIKDLPEAILTGLTRGDQLRIIRLCSWIPSNAAAFSVAAGDPAEESLRLRESSRCIIWENLLNEKSDIGPLEARHPELAHRFRSLQTKLAQTMPSNKFADHNPALMFKQQENHQASLEYNSLLTEIRGLEDFESFLRLPQETSSLTAYASDGPVIIINSNEFQSDCFIIKREGVVSIPLPEMTVKENALHATYFLMALSDLENNPKRALEKFEKVLLWLWNVAAQPVMSELGLYGSNQSNLERPRVWWMATGCLGMLPIHAAGDHRKSLATGELCSVLDLTTSSYCNSLRSLNYVREIFAASKYNLTGSNRSLSAVSVQMATTSDHDALPSAAKEVSTVRGILHDTNISTSILGNPTRNEVLPRLKTCDIVHFACHGIVDAEDPSLSKLMLQTGKHIHLA